MPEMTEGLVETEEILDQGWKSGFASCECVWIFGHLPGNISFKFINVRLFTTTKKRFPLKGDLSSWQKGPSCAPYTF